MELDRRIVELIEDEKVVGLFQGRMEFGPRALGCRSIIGDARSRTMQSVMNLKIKYRESFRPFAPIVLAEHAADWFDLAGGQDSPYMLIVSPVAEARRLPVDDGGTVGLAKLKLARSEVPAITHVDGSARVQTVDPVRHGRLHRLMTRFFERTGCPVLINTSFNVRGEPIVCSPEHAYHCFMGTEMDVLVLGNHLLIKSEQPTSRVDREGYLARFELD
jgi:carbamoyltransferase